MVKINVNGVEYQAEAGKRLLLTLNEIGVRVPHLCFHHALTPAAACKLCVVEVKEPEKPIRTRLACAVKITDGMDQFVCGDHYGKRNNQPIQELLQERNPVQMADRNPVDKCGPLKNKKSGNDNQIPAHAPGTFPEVTGGKFHDAVIIAMIMGSF